MRAAVDCALAPLAPLAAPARFAHAQAERGVARAMAVAPVHATPRSGRAAQRAAIRRVALALSGEAPAAAVARRLPPWPCRARLVLALAAAPTGVARARAAHAVARAVAAAPARAGNGQLARRPRKVRTACAHAGGHRAARAAAVAVSWARATRTVGSRPAISAHAHPLRRVARAVRTASLRRPAARAQRSRQPRDGRHRRHRRGAIAVHAVAVGVKRRAVELQVRGRVGGAHGGLAGEATPPRVADAAAVVRAVAASRAVVLALWLGAVRPSPAELALTSAGAGVGGLDADAVRGAVGGAGGRLARGAREGRLARARRRARVFVHHARASRTARRRAWAGGALARRTTPAGAAAAAATGPTLPVRRAAALILRLVARAAPLRAALALPTFEARAAAIGHARPLGRTPAGAGGHLAVWPRPAVVAHALGDQRRVERRARVPASANEGRQNGEAARRRRRRRRRRHLRGARAVARAV